MGLNEQRVGIWRISLEQIEATVSDHLGRGRVPGNQPGACLSRQVSMYLAKNVAGWSTTRIGRFYNGRHHSIVLHAIAKIGRLRETDESVDALIEVLTAALGPTMDGQHLERKWSKGLIDAVGPEYWNSFQAQQREDSMEEDIPDLDAMVSLQWWRLWDSGLLTRPPDYSIADFEIVRGRTAAERTLEVAATSAHNVLRIGPAGRRCWRSGLPA
jgi:hypothetical protein